MRTFSLWSSKIVNKKMSIMVKLIIVIAFGLALCQFFPYTATSAGYWARTVVIGSSIPDNQLDGKIGSEWEDAASSNVYFGGYGYKKKYRLSIHMKYDLTYLYIAVVRNGPVWGGNPTLWVTIDATGDGRVYRRGDDGVILPITDGKLVDNIDYAYYQYGKPPKSDLVFGGTNDKKGASRASTYKYVYELKIPLASGDHGSLGNDIALWPGDRLVTVFGLMNNIIEIPSETGDQRLERPNSNPCASLEALAGQECDVPGSIKECEYTIRHETASGQVIIISGTVMVICRESVHGEPYWRYKRIP